jgi:hypothetical protein
MGSLSLLKRKAIPRALADTKAQLATAIAGLAVHLHPIRDRPT